jgi:hypothetical protein
MNIFYFGVRPKASLSQMFEQAGFTIVHARYTKGVLGSSSACGAVLHWKSKRNQPAIEEAKAAGVPILVVTSKLADAIRAGTSADLYLEEPASDEEVATLLLDMVTAKPLARAVAAATGAVN